MMSNKTILVTGSAGFIGFHLTKALIQRGCTVVGVDNFNDYYEPAIKEARSAILKDLDGYIERRFDICDLPSLEAVFSEFKIDMVCNLAAQAGVRYSITNPHAYEASNLAGFLNILEMVRHNKIDRLVYASSSSVYGGNTKVPFAETDAVDNPVSLYAATKKANELMAHSYSHLYGFQSIGLRFFTVYGPWGRPDMAMWLFAEAIKAGTELKVFNNGEMKRDFTYVDDVVDGVCGALFADGLDQYEIFNLGNHQCQPLMKMIDLIEESMGEEANKVMYPMQAGDVPATYADVSKAQAKLGYNPSTSIEKGIPLFVDWYKSNHELAQKVIDARD